MLVSQATVTLHTGVATVISSHTDLMELTIPTAEAGRFSYETFCNCGVQAKLQTRLKAAGSENPVLGVCGVLTSMQTQQSTPPQLLPRRTRKEAGATSAAQGMSINTP